MSDAAAHDLTTLHVRAAVAGDPAGTAALIERFTPLLLAQARYRLAGPAAAFCEPEDLVQEAWAITLPRLRDLECRDGRMTPVLMKFLATTLLRCATQVLRKHVLGRPRAVPAPHDPEASHPVARLAAETSGAITQLCRRSQLDALQQAIAALPDAEREVLILRGIEQQRNADIAQLLGVDDAVVTRRFQRALASLRNLLPAELFAAEG